MNRLTHPVDNPDYWLVIDLEATCCDDERFPRREMEIIEIGAVMADARSYRAVDEFQTFVRPVRHPVLTTFCRQLTGITQENVDAADGFAQAMTELTKWMACYPGSIFCSWGDYDLRQFERDCTFHSIAWPFGERHVNLKKRFGSRFKLKRGEGLIDALRKHSLTFEGRPHRGIDDARNITRLLPILLGQ